MRYGAVHRHRPKNRRRAVIYVSTGLACLPRDTMSAHCYRRSAVIYVSTGLAGLPRDTMSTHHYRRRAVSYVSTGLARLPRDARSTRHYRRRAVIYVSTGLARLPRDAMSAHRHRRNYNPCFIQPLFGGRLLFLDRPQVGKPTWGYDYTTALRRLPSPSDCHHHRPQKTAPHRHAPMARCIAIAKKPPKSGCIC